MFTKHTTKYLLQASGTALSLVLIYSTTGILLAKQVALFVHTSETQVKNEEYETPQVGHITTSDTVEPLAPTNDRPEITTYTVVSGDTVASIAKKFDISANTVRFANDLSPKTPLKLGQKLVILPVTGVAYEIQKGDTLGSIAKKFKTDQDEITSFNDIDGTKIKIGQTIIIPDAEPIAPTETKKPEVVKNKEVEKAPEKAPTKTTEDKSSVPAPAPVQVETPAPTSTLDAPVAPTEEAPKKNTDGYFTMPIPGAHISQGLHGYNSVDFAAPLGTPILAAADGIVIVAKTGNGWGGGYGNYIVVSHPNGTQTLYAHLSKVEVDVEDTVKQGQEIGKCGRTGRATGTHLHFEVRGGTNPWVGIKVGTSY